MRIRCEPFDVDVRSVAGVETCIEVRELKLAFDVGKCPESAILARTVCLTHAHLDHASGLAYHCGIRAMRGMPPPRYLVPPAIVEPLNRLFDATAVLDHGSFPREVIPLGPGDEHVIRPDVVITSVATDHRVPSQGYVLWQRRKHLRPEFRGLPGSDLAARRQAGDSIEEVVDQPILAFTGDTTADVLDREPVLLTAPTLLVEATFLGDSPPVTRAREFGHVHLDELAARADQFQNDQVVLLHLSARYSKEQIDAAFGRLPESLRQRAVVVADVLE